DVCSSDLGIEGGARFGAHPGGPVVEVVGRHADAALYLVAGVDEPIADDGAPIPAAGGVEVVHGKRAKTGAEQQLQSVVHDPPPAEVPRTEWAARPVPGGPVRLGPRVLPTDSCSRVPKYSSALAIERRADRRLDRGTELARRPAVATERCERMRLEDVV